jgi:hypothetical protein
MDSGRKILPARIQDRVSNKLIVKMVAINRAGTALEIRLKPSPCILFCPAKHWLS